MGTVVVMGGGTGGAVVARSLVAHRPPQWEVTLVERQARVYYQPSYLQVMVGQRSEPVGRSITNLRRSGIRVVVDTVQAVDPERHRLRLTKGDLAYDILVIAAGAEAGRADPPELGFAGFNLYTAEGAMQISRAMQTMERGEVVLLAAGLPFRCPPALYEAAMLISSYARKRGREIWVRVYTPEKTPFSLAGAKVSESVGDALAKAGIDLYTGRFLDSVHHAKRRLRFTDGHEDRYDLLIYIPRHHCPDAISHSGLNDETGWVPVDPFTLATSSENVYAIGDVTRLRLPSGDNLFKSGQVAHFQALVVADNIVTILKGGSPQRFYGGKMGYVVETAATNLAMVGDMYRLRPGSFILPASRGWRVVKWLAEKAWLRDHG